MIKIFLALQKRDTFICKFSLFYSQMLHVCKYFFVKYKIYVACLVSVDDGVNYRLVND